MAESDKTEHISKSKMERFSVRTLSESELTKVARHLTGCLDCQAEFVSTLRRQRGVADLSFTLAPEFWIGHEHLDYDQLLNLADEKLDATDREFIDDHLKMCRPCQEDVRSFLAFRQQIAPEMSVSYAPVSQEPAHERLSWVNWWRGLAWKPVYSAAVVVVGIALVIGAILLLTRSPTNEQVQQVPTPSPVSTPAIATILPSSTASPHESPTESASLEEAVVLNDQGRTIKIDKSGNVTGLEDVPAPTRNEIAQVVLSGRIVRPTILKDLGGHPTVLRGSNSDQPFKLISPARTVIVSDRPTFRWDSVSGATAYTVYVNDVRGQIVARSDELTPDRREWIAQNRLKRGAIYAWTVTAIVDGKEITSPGPTAPEMKFQVLSATDLAQLNQLKRLGSHLALGIFYARAGMIAQAEREFQTVVRQNPSSEAATKLLKEIRAWPNR